MKIKLGNRYRDTISGFEGVATARFEYLYGCVRYCLESEIKDGKTQDLVFDEQRLEAADKVPITRTARSGGPHQTPPRTGASSG